MKALFKIHGGKSYLYHWIISHLPPGTLIEACFGAGTVSYNLSGSIGIESNYQTYCIHKYLPQIISRLRNTTYSEETFRASLLEYEDPLDIAWAGFCKHRMSRGGRGKDYSWSDRLRGGQPENLNAWENILSKLDLYVEKQKSIQLIYGNLFDVLPEYNSHIIYVDPPYLHSTRASKTEYGEHEWDENRHIKLSELAHSSSSQFVISAYRSELYDKLYGKPIEKIMPNHSGQTKKKNKRIECLYFA